jgi:hypothetical protein
MTLKEFNSKYKYQRDIDKFGLGEVWSEPKLSNGFYYGDCEDYCIFLKNNVSEFKDWEYYYCTIHGAGHCILVKDGYCIDCNYKKIISLELYKDLYRMDNLKKYSLFVKASKFLVGYIVVAYHNIKNTIKGT